MPEGRTAKHRSVILQANEGWLTDQGPVEEAEEGDRDDGQEQKGQQAKKAGQQERIRLEGDFCLRAKPTTLLHCARLSENCSPCSALAYTGYIPSEFLHMLDPSTKADTHDEKYLH